MAGSTKTWLNNNPPSCEDDDLNGFKNENNNLILGSGQSLNTSDNQQTHKAVSAYAAHGDFYSDAGVANAYVLSTQGGKVAPDVYADGMRIRFRTANANTGPSTANPAALGVKDIRLPGGGVLLGGEITANRNIKAIFNLSGDYFELDLFEANPPEASQAEMEAGTESDLRSMSPLLVAQAIDEKVGGLVVLPPIAIGDWDMDTDVGVAVAHGLTLSKIRSISAIIIHDSSSIVTDFSTGPPSGGVVTAEGSIEIGSVSVTLVRRTGGNFDNTSYDSTSFNRGWITIWYDPS